MVVEGEKSDVRRVSPYTEKRSAWTAVYVQTFFVVDPRF